MYFLKQQTDDPLCTVDNKKLTRNATLKLSGPSVLNYSLTTSPRTVMVIYWVKDKVCPWSSHCSPTENNRSKAHVWNTGAGPCRLTNRLKSILPRKKNIEDGYGCRELIKIHASPFRNSNELVTRILLFMRALNSNVNRSFVSAKHRELESYVI